MMTREEVAEVITYCKKNNISYKTRLAELGIPAWKFYDSNSRYALEQESSEAKGEFLQLYAGVLQPFLERLLGVVSLEVLEDESSAAAPQIFFRYYYENSSTGEKSGTMLSEVTWSEAVAGGGD